MNDDGSVDVLVEHVVLCKGISCTHHVVVVAKASTLQAAGTANMAVVGGSA